MWRCLKPNVSDGEHQVETAGRPAAASAGTRATLRKMVGRRDDAHKLWHLAEDAKALVRDLIARHDIACDYKSGILHADHKQRYVEHSPRVCREAA